MKIVLNSDVDGLGTKGQVVDVAPGYARNFLIPRKMALAATKGSLRQAESMRRARESLEARARAHAEDLAARISQAALSISARAGEEGQLFGSITTSDIADALAGALGEEIDRRKVLLAEPVRSLGVHVFSVQVRGDIVAKGSVEVVART